jgi:uncharacterized protein YoxC
MSISAIKQNIGTTQREIESLQKQMDSQTRDENNYLSKIKNLESQISNERRYLDKIRVTKNDIIKKVSEKQKMLNQYMLELQKEEKSGR